MPIVAQHFDSNLGRWTHTGWRPGPGDPLESAVDRVWDFDGMAAHPQERVFPNGHLELIVQLDDRYLDVTTAGAPGVRGGVQRLRVRRGRGCAPCARAGGGAEIVRALADTGYGSREYGTRDLDGHYWYFGNYRPA